MNEKLPEYCPKSVEEIINSYRTKKNKDYREFLKNFKTAEEFQEYLKIRNEEIKNMAKKSSEIIKNVLKS